MIQKLNPIDASYSIISQQVQQLGRHIKKTKKKLSWKFKIQQDTHELSCTVSKLSGKRLVKLDNNCLVQTKIQNKSFQFEYPFKGLYLKLYLYKDSGQLYLEKQSYSQQKLGTCVDNFLEMRNKYSQQDIVDIYSQYY